MRLSVKGLLPDTQYTVQVRAKSGDESSEWSPQRKFTTIFNSVLPKTPTNVSWVAMDKHFKGEWDKVNRQLDEDFAKVVRYDVELEKPDGTLREVIPHPASDEPRQSFKLGEQKMQAIFGQILTSVKFRVRAVTQNENKSAWSAPITAGMGAPNAPTNAVATPGPLTVKLSWTPPVDMTNVDGYRVYVGSSTTPSYQGGAPGYTYNALNFNLHTFKICSYSRHGLESSFLTITATPGSLIDSEPPAQPSSITGSITNSADNKTATATVNWTLVSPPADLGGFNIRFRKVGAGYWDMASTDAAARTVSFGVTPFVNYEVSLQSLDLNANGSAWSTPLTLNAVANTPPPAVTGLTSTAQRESIVYSWTASTATDVANQAGHYELQVSTLNTFTAGTTTTFISGFPTYDVAGLSANTTYYARVRAVDSGGMASAAWSTIDTETTQSFPLTPLSDGQAPASSPTPTVIGGLGYITALWPAITNNDPVTYEVHLGTGSAAFAVSAATKVGEIGGTMTVIRNLPGTTTPLAYGTNYYVRIVAKDVDNPAAAGTGSTAVQILKSTIGDITLTPGDIGAPTTAQAQGYANTAQTNAISAAATDAQTKATAAETAAKSYTDNREVAITNAYQSAITTSANGKNKITHSTSAASGANTLGDTWFQYNGSDQVIGQWRGMGGSTWVSETVASQVIANLDVAKLTTGTIASAVITINTTGQIKSQDYVANSAGWSLSNGGLQINNGIVDAKVMKANSSFVNNLFVESTIQVGTAATTGFIQSYGYSAGVQGFSLSKTGLVIEGTGNVIAAAAVNTGVLDAARVRIGSASTYDAGYNPTQKVTTFTTSGAAPVTPTAIVSGDLWIHTNAGITKIYRATAAGTASWALVSDDSALPTTFVQATAPTALAAGDIWVDTDDGKMYRSTAAGSASWVLFNDPATSGNQTFTTNVAIPTNPTALAAGDMWLDQFNKKIYRATAAGTASWVLMQDLNTKASTFVTNVATPTNPTATSAGDIWVDQYNNLMYRSTAAGTASWVIVNNPVAAIQSVWGHPLNTTLIDGGDIYTNTIRANAITVGDFTNYIADGDLIDPNFSNWSAGTHGLARVAGSAGTPPYMKWNAALNANAHVFNNYFFEVRPGDSFYFSGEVSTPATNTANVTIVASIQTRDASDAVVTWPQTSGMSVAPNTGWTAFTGTMTVAAGNSIKGQFDPFAQSTASGQEIRMRNMRLRKRFGGELVVDGSIEANKITAGEYTGGAFIIGAGGILRTLNSEVTLTSSGITVTGANSSIVADAISGGNITAGKTLTVLGTMKVATNGWIESNNFATSGGSQGYRLTSSSLTIKDGSISAKTLTSGDIGGGAALNITGSSYINVAAGFIRGGGYTGTSYNSNPSGVGWYLGSDGLNMPSQPISAGSITSGNISSATIQITGSGSIYGSGWSLGSGGLVVSSASGTTSITGDAIKTGAIQSQGAQSYIAGSRGWSINTNGSVEFNTGTFRGAIYAASGTFSGALAGATGTFSGTITGSTFSTGGTTRAELYDGLLVFRSGTNNVGIISATSSGLTVSASGLAMYKMFMTDAMTTFNMPVTVQAGFNTWGGIDCGGNLSVSGFLNLNNNNITSANTINTTDLYVNTTTTTTNSINVNLNSSSGRILRSTASSARYKTNIHPLPVTAEAVLSLEPVEFNYIPEHYSNPDEDVPGFIAEQAESLGLTHLVEYRDDGMVEGFRYDRLAIYQQVVIRKQQEQIADLSRRLDALGA